jgi:hypothetical protein
VAVEEVQDNSGTTDDGVVAADQTLGKLANAITAAGMPMAPGRPGQRRGRRQHPAGLYRTDRGLSFVDRPGASSTTADSVVNTGGVPSLKYSPGRISPTDSAWSSSREPLAGEFTWQGKTFFAIA